MLTKEIRTILLIILATVVNTVPRWLPYEVLYFKMQALSVLFWAIAAKSKKNTELTLIFWDWTIGLAINNLFDELFGDPVHVGLIEISVAILITICTIYRVIKCLKTVDK